MINPLIVIVGPTAVGKTQTAISLAQRLDGEIISADSRLFYRGMDIGTAKPSVEERGGIPHHLIDVAEPADTWSLAAFQAKAVEIIQEIQGRKKLPFLVGGTGQYIHAVVDGWVIPAQEADLRLRSVLELWAKEIGADGLFRKLRIIDPEAASHIEYQNIRRTVRALEVIFLTGKKFSAQRTKGGTLYNVLMVGLNRPRSELYERIDLRIDNMISSGLVEETRKLLTEGYSPNLPAMTAIGYREAVGYLQGTLTRDEAVTLMKRATRQFVRRQANWFKETDPQINWFNMDDKVADRVEKLIREYLSS